MLPGLLRQRGINGRDAALATELCYGTCRAQGLLDAVLQSCADRPLSEVDGELLDALRLGSYQLLRTRVPPHAAVATTVDLVRAGRGSAAAGFVNAVLRRVGGKDEAGWVAAVAPAADDDPVGHLAMAHPHPRWIAQAFTDALGGDLGELAEALAADDTRPLVHLAARPGQISAAELAELTGGRVAPYSPSGVHLSEGGDPGELTPYAITWPKCRMRAASWSPSRWRRCRWTAPIPAGWTCAPGREARQPCWVPWPRRASQSWMPWRRPSIGPGWSAKRAPACR